MIAAALLASLVVLDCMIAGFRAAAGRNGQLDKRAYYRRAMTAGAIAGAVIVIAHAALAALLVATSSVPAQTWSVFVSAATTLLWIYGAYATLVLGAFAFYFAPIGDYRVLTSVIVFGPLTLVRRAVIVAGFAVVVFQLRSELRIWGLIACAAVTMLTVETWLGRKYAEQWRRLLV